MSADCTGTAEYKLQMLPTGPVIGPDRHRILVLQEGNPIRRLMVEAAGRTTITTTELVRLSHAKAVCHKSALRGSCLLHDDGWVNMQAANPNQAAYYAPAVGIGFRKIDPEKGDAAGHSEGERRLHGCQRSAGGSQADQPACSGELQMQ